VYEIPREEKRRLDRVEGLGHGYAETTVDVTVGLDTIRAVMYYATDKDRSLIPYHWYKAYVIAGAQEHTLPQDYIDLVEQMPSMDDPDVARSTREAAILSDG
jgi:hypothetical protein